MLIFYGEAQGRANVPVESPINESLENVITIFRSLDTRRGFMGIPLQAPFVLQLLPSESRVRVEFLHTSQPSLDSSEGDKAFAERLLEAASEGLDVFQVARQGLKEWDHVSLH